MKWLKRFPKLNQAGFSLPELISVMIVSSLFAGLILFFMFSYWRYAALLEADLDTFVTRLNAGDFLRENLSGSTGLIIQNGIPDSNTLLPDPTIPSNLYWSPIHAVPGNKPIGSAGTITPLLYFKRLSINTSGSIIMNGSQPYEDEFIIYLNGTTKQLLMRSLANPYASSNRTVTSCPPASASASCPADKVIAGDIASIDLRYFARSGTLIDWTSIYDTTISQYVGPDFPVVEAVEVTVNLTRKPFLQKTNATVNQTVVRIALRNT